MGRSDTAAIDKILANSSRILIAIASWFLVNYVGEIKTAIKDLTDRTGSLEIAQARAQEKLQILERMPQALTDIQRTLDKAAKNN